MPRRIATLILAAALALALSSCVAEPATIYTGIDELSSRQPSDDLLLKVVRALDAPLDPSLPINLDADVPLGASASDTPLESARPVTIAVDYSGDGYGIFTLTLAAAPTA